MSHPQSRIATHWAMAAAGRPIHILQDQPFACKDVVDRCWLNVSIEKSSAVITLVFDRMYELDLASQEACFSEDDRDRNHLKKQTIQSYEDFETFLKHFTLTSSFDLIPTPEHSVSCPPTTTFCMSGDAGSFVFDDYGVVIGLLYAWLQRNYTAYFPYILDLFEDMKNITGAIDVWVEELWKYTSWYGMVSQPLLSFAFWFGIRTSNLTDGKQLMRYIHRTESVIISSLLLSFGVQFTDIDMQIEVVLTTSPIINTETGNVC